jgi:hypothetical protein
MFGRLKDWRRIAMRYDTTQRCNASPAGKGYPEIFLSAVTLAAIILFWL